MLLGKAAFCCDDSWLMNIGARKLTDQDLVIVCCHLIIADSSVILFIQNQKPF